MEGDQSHVAFYTDKRTGTQNPADIHVRILGATIVAQHVGEMNNKITVAVVAGIALCTLAPVTTLIRPRPMRTRMLQTPLATGLPR